MGISDDVQGWLRAGRSPEEVVAELKSRGLSEPTAWRFVQRGMSPPVLPPDDQGEERLPTGTKDIVLGLFFLVGGLVVTGLTYVLAEAGDTYVVAYGAVIFGAIDLFRGLRRWSRQPEARPFPWLGAGIAAMLPIVAAASFLGYRASSSRSVRVEESERMEVDDRPTMVGAYRRPSAAELQAQKEKSRERRLQMGLENLEKVRGYRWCRVALSLVEEGVPEVKPRLLKMLDETDRPLEQSCAADMLLDLGERRLVVGYYIAHLRSEHRDLRRACTKGIASILEAAVEGQDPQLEALRSTVRPTIPTLIALVERDSDIPVRVGATDSLGWMGSDAEAALPALRELRDQVTPWPGAPMAAGRAVERIESALESREQAG